MSGATEVSNVGVPPVSSWKPRRDLKNIFTGVSTSPTAAAPRVSSILKNVENVYSVSGNSKKILVYTDDATIIIEEVEQV